MMKTINELINQLKDKEITCKKLGELCSIEKGEQLNKSLMAKDYKLPVFIYPVYNGGTNPSGYWDKFNVDKDTISISQGGCSAGYVNWIKENFWAGAHCFFLKKCEINYRYLYFYLKFNQDKLYELQQGAGIPGLSKQDLYNLDIYFPSLPYQQQIVKILDEFTELEAELEARKVQCKFWQQYLLNDKNWATTDIIHIKLKDLFNYRNGYTPLTTNESFWKDGTIPWFRVDDIHNFGSILYDSDKHITPIAVKGDNYIEPDSIIITTTATIGVHALVKVKSLCNQRFTILTLKNKYKNKIDMKFIYYYCYLLDKFCIQHQNASTFNSVDMSEFENFIFNIPSLEYQQKIVSILDQFNNLTTNLQDGIPAEIKLRNEQYHYYLKQLLCFDK